MQIIFVSCPSRQTELDEGILFFHKIPQGFSPLLPLLLSPLLPPLLLPLLPTPNVYQAVYSTTLPVYSLGRESRGVVPSFRVRARNEQQRARWINSSCRTVLILVTFMNLNLVQRYYNSSVAVSWCFINRDRIKRTLRSNNCDCESIRNMFTW